MIEARAIASAAKQSHGRKEIASSLALLAMTDPIRFRWIAP
jgi:hypothetical protein